MITSPTRQADLPDGPSIPGPILVMGTGAVGGWVGGRLAASGVPVHFVTRPATKAALRAQGLTTTDLDGLRVQVPASELLLYDAVPASPAPALVLLAVKSGATAQAAAELAAVLPAGTVVLSLQNGVGNTAVAQAAAPQLTVLSGMVPYNIAEVAPGHLHRGTGGRLMAASHPCLEPWVPVFERAAVPLQLVADMEAVQWGKLLINLNNPVNALSGLPLRPQLLDTDLRRCLAALIDEALQVLEACGVRAAKVTAITPRRLVQVLRLPTPLFRLVAARMLRVDHQARSSMADDLQRGRVTEVDMICGAVVDQARQQGLDAPLNRRIAELVHAWPEAPRRWSGRELWAELKTVVGK